MKTVKSNSAVKADIHEHCFTEDYISEFLDSLDEVVGTIGMLSQMGAMKDASNTEYLDVDDICTCLRGLDRRLKELRDGMREDLEVPHKEDGES